MTDLNQQTSTNCVPLSFFPTETSISETGSKPAGNGFVINHNISSTTTRKAGSSVSLENNETIIPTLGSPSISSTTTTITTTATVHMTNVTENVTSAHLAVLTATIGDDGVTNSQETLMTTKRTETAPFSSLFPTNICSLPPHFPEVFKREREETEMISETSPEKILSVKKHPAPIMFFKSHPGGLRGRTLGSSGSSNSFHNLGNLGVPPGPNPFSGIGAKPLSTPVGLDVPLSLMSIHHTSLVGKPKPIGLRSSPLTGSPTTPLNAGSPTFGLPKAKEQRYADLLETAVSVDKDLEISTEELRQICLSIAKAALKDSDPSHVVKRLYAHLRDVKNGELRAKVLSSQITSEALVAMNESELMNPDLRCVAEKDSARRFKDRDQEELKKATMQSSSMFHCKKCKQRNVSFYEKQTRSADEPMTVFITCNVCNNKWKEN